MTDVKTIPLAVVAAPALQRQSGEDKIARNRAVFADAPDRARAALTAYEGQASPQR